MVSPEGNSPESEGWLVVSGQWSVRREKVRSPKGGQLSVVRISPEGNSQKERGSR